MGKWASIGLLMVIVGILIWLAYGVYLGFEEILKAIDVITGFVVGIILVGLFVLTFSIVIEQQKDTKKMKKKIKKEDLNP